MRRCGPRSRFRRSSRRRARGRGRSAPRRPGLTFASSASASAKVRSASSRASESTCPSRCCARTIRAATSASSRAAFSASRRCKRVGVGRQGGLGFLQRAQDRAVELGKRFLRAGLGARDARPGSRVIAEGPADQRAEQEADRIAEQIADAARADPTEPPSVILRIELGRRDADPCGRRGKPALGRADVRPPREKLRAVADRDRLVELQR